MNENNLLYTCSKIRGISLFSEKGPTSIKKLKSYLKKNNISEDEFLKSNTKNQLRIIADVFKHHFDFFKNSQDLQEFIKTPIKEYLNDLSARSITDFTILNYPSSLGEYALSFLILLKNHFKDSLINFKIEAFEKHPETITLAKKFQFNSINYEQIPLEYQNQFINNLEYMTPKKELVKNISFIEGDFSLPTPRTFKEKYDLILCPYFLSPMDNKDILDILTNLNRTLKPGGFLLLDPQEKIIETLLFIKMNINGSLYYKKEETIISLAQKKYQHINKGRGNNSSHFVYEGQYIIKKKDEGDFKILLGSCVAVILKDINDGTYGACHYIKAKSNNEELNNSFNGDVAIELLINEMKQQGHQLTNLTARVYGAATISSQSELSKEIALDNVAMARSVLKKMNIPILEEETGGIAGREIIVSPSSDSIQIKLMEKFKS